ncbi:MAG: GNAT family N-acetyltransferase [Rhizobiales bacterium]|nr:GNAT family N-acetyltransferase [Hyphomicrobiales bacterium]|tara:strand:+ start:1429 stop:1839 length:411 start_codon:yes stop_codon:yes gene_type:complete
MTNIKATIELSVSPHVDTHQLQELLRASWEDHIDCDLVERHASSLAYIVAYVGGDLVGYLNIAHDGCRHAFIVDVTVHPNMRRMGIALGMLKKAVDICTERGYEWIHLDFDDHLEPLYRKAGFKIGKSGLFHITNR